MIEAEILDDTKEIVLSEIKYPVNEDSLQKLLNEYKDIPNIDPDADEEIVAEQFQFVSKGHKAFVKARTGIEKTRKQLKQPALDYGKSVDSIAKEFQSMIKETEQKLLTQRKIVEENEARKQREAEAKEEARIEKIKDAIRIVKDLPLLHFNSTSDEITTALESLRVITKAEYEEFYDEAMENQKYVISQLQQARDNRIKVEQAEKIQAEAQAKADAEEAEREAMRVSEQKKLDDERAEFEKQKAEFEEQQRVIQEQKAKAEAELEAEELMKKQEEERKQRAIQEEQERKSRDQKNKQRQAECENEAFIDLDNLLNAEGVDVVTLVDMIIEEKVRHIKWVQDEQ